MWRAREALAALAAARKGTPAKKDVDADDDEAPLGGDSAALDAARLKAASLGVPRDAAFGYVERCCNRRCSACVARRFSWRRRWRWCLRRSARAPR
jgi:hypothetical protein